MRGGTQALLRAVQQWAEQPGSGEGGSELPISASVQAQDGVTPAELPALTELWASRNQTGQREAGMGSSGLLAAETRCGMQTPSSAASSPPSAHTLLSQVFERRVGLPDTLEEQLPQRPLEGRCLHCWFPSHQRGRWAIYPSSHLHSPTLTPQGVMISVSKAPSCPFLNGSPRHP